jgi:hypothetical protein
MPLLYSLLLASLALELTVAVPMQQSSRGIRVDMVPRAQPRMKSVLHSYAKALRKFGAAELAETVSKAAASVNDSSVVATPGSNDVEYTCPVTIGKQVFQLDFDTGSSDL